MQASMEIKDWITIGSASLLVVGWFFNSHLNRRHEIFKKRLELRLRMYEACLRPAEAFEKIVQGKVITDDLKASTAAFVDDLQKCHVNVLLYGTEEEIESINRVVSFAQSNRHLELKNAMAAFIVSIRSTLRSDLKLSVLPTKGEDRVIDKPTSN